LSLNRLTLISSSISGRLEGIVSSGRFMDQGGLNIGFVQTLDAESFGEPGQRTFRLTATAGAGRVSLWMEKEQIVMLGNAAAEILERVPEPLGEDPKAASAAGEVSGEVEARVGSSSLGFDRVQNGFVIEATELWDATLNVTFVRLLANRAQLDHINEQVGEIIAGSRPRCPMCGQPLTEEAHFCPPSNGHARVSDG
jgi:uncharacterized repeat protein (TIGR03847 family)